MIYQLIEKRKVLLKRESDIVDRRSEIFKIENSLIVMNELKKLNIEAQKLANDWWTLNKEIMALTPLKYFVFNILKDL